jgi:peroxiredoxin
LTFEPLNSPGAPSPPLYAGDPVPWFTAPSDLGPDFKMPSLGGRWTLLVFLDGFRTRTGQRVLPNLRAGAKRLHALDTAMLLISRSPEDKQTRLPPGASGMRLIFDDDGAIAKRFGAEGPVVTFLVDPLLRINAVIADAPPERHAEAAFAVLDQRPPASAPPAAHAQAPVLLVDDVFEPDLCRGLIEGHERDGGRETGFMVERDGKTVEVMDPDLKRRTDWTIENEHLQVACRLRIQRRLVPALRRAFQFEATRIERYLVARYDSESEGHFAAHRDNTTKGTAHRRFAVSINLNGDFEGGDLVFPEFGQARFRPSPGGAYVFSCSLLHQALPVTQGRRYVFVPFLYDEAGAAIRDANRGFIA